MGPFFSDAKPAAPGATAHRDLAHRVRSSSSLRPPMQEQVVGLGALLKCVHVRSLVLPTFLVNKPSFVTVQRTP